MAKIKQLTKIPTTPKAIAKTAAKVAEVQETPGAVLIRKRNVGRLGKI
jgi:hypothetical protein